MALETIDDYLAQQSAETRTVLQQIREAIHEAAPDIEETLSYQIPTFKHNGALVSFGVAQNHNSFYIMSPSAMETLKDDLQGLKISGTSIHFVNDKPLPAALVKRIVAVRIQENDAKK